MTSPPPKASDHFPSDPGIPQNGEWVFLQNPTETEKKGRVPSPPPKQTRAPSQPSAPPCGRLDAFQLLRQHQLGLGEARGGDQQHHVVVADAHTPPGRWGWLEDGRVGGVGVAGGGGWLGGWVGGWGGGGGEDWTLKSLWGNGRV